MKSFILSAHCCPGVLEFNSAHPNQTVRLGDYELTCPLQTTSYGDKYFPVFKKDGQYLSRSESGGASPWVVGSSFGTGSGGYFLGKNVQCPEYLSEANVFSGGIVPVANSDWSMVCHAGEKM